MFQILMRFCSAYNEKTAKWAYRLAGTLAPLGARVNTQKRGKGTRCSPVSSYFAEGAEAPIGRSRGSVDKINSQTPGGKQRWVAKEGAAESGGPFGTFRNIMGGCLLVKVGKVKMPGGLCYRQPAARKTKAAWRGTCSRSAAAASSLISMRLPRLKHYIIVEHQTAEMPAKPRAETPSPARKYWIRDGRRCAYNKNKGIAGSLGLVLKAEVRGRVVGAGVQKGGLAGAIKHIGSPLLTLYNIKLPHALQERIQPATQEVRADFRQETRHLGPARALVRKKPGRGLEETQHQAFNCQAHRQKIPIDRTIFYEETQKCSQTHLNPRKYSEGRQNRDQSGGTRRYLAARPAARLPRRHRPPKRANVVRLQAFPLQLPESLLRSVIWEPSQGAIIVGLRDLQQQQYSKMQNRTFSNLTLLRPAQTRHSLPSLHSQPPPNRLFYFEALQTHKRKSIIIILQRPKACPFAATGRKRASAFLFSEGPGCFARSWVLNMMKIQSKRIFCIFWASIVLSEVGLGAGKRRSRAKQAPNCAYGRAKGEQIKGAQ